MKKEFFGVIREVKKLKWGGFIILETFGGQYQCVSKDPNLNIKPESYVKILGELTLANVSKELVNHSCEISIESIEVLTEPTSHFDINIYEKDLRADIHTQLDNRAITLRNEKNKCIFKIQSTIQNSFRNILDDFDFFSISTPKLVANGAEGGTDVFKLDYFGQEAYLAQSPQLYKQMMCGVLGKVYETAPVFRAERHNSSRHLNEYISLDVETILRKDFMELIRLEIMILNSIINDVNHSRGDCLSYLGQNIQNAESSLILKVQQIKEILGTQGHDLSNDEEREIARYALEKYKTDFVFATHYHRELRPFYTKLSSDGITTESFDCIYRGIEITSGGQRKEGYQEYLDVIQESGMNTEPFKEYLDTFKYGMPLHGGFAIGLERLTAKICGLDNMKFASLFPRDINRLTP